MIGSGAQIRAARGFLGWSQEDLARESGLSINAVRYWEAGHGWPISMRSARSDGPVRIELTFNRYGLKLTYDPPSVQTNKRYAFYLTPPIYARHVYRRKPANR